MSRAKYQRLSSTSVLGDEAEATTTATETIPEQPFRVDMRKPSEDQEFPPQSQSTATATAPAAQQQQQLHEISLDDNSTQPQQQPQEDILVQQPQQQGNLPSPAELPSYNEALRLKKLEASSNDLPPAYFTSAADAAAAGDQAHFMIDPSDVPNLVDDPHLPYDQDIGSECMFLSAFMIAFFFNWIGFFASVCLLPNAAGKYGALSGFGLSMAKWVTIVRYQDWMVNMNDFQQKLFFWLFIFLGFYLFFRGLINYMTLKYRPITSSDYQRRNRWLTFLD